METRNMWVVLETLMNDSHVMSCGLMASCEARRWSLGNTTTSGSLVRSLNTRLVVCVSGRRKATSSLPLTRAPARSGEYWLEMVISILGSSSRRRRIASGSRSEERRVGKECKCEGTGTEEIEESRD